MVFLSSKSRVSECLFLLSYLKNTYLPPTLSVARLSDQPKHWPTLYVRCAVKGIFPKRELQGFT